MAAIHPLGAAAVTFLLLSSALAGCLAGKDDDGRDLSYALKKKEKPEKEKKDKDDPPAKGGFSQTSVFPGEYRVKGNHSLVLAPGPYVAADPVVVNLPIGVPDLVSPRGANLQIGYVLPVAPPGTKFPVIVQASPYYGPLTPANFHQVYNSNPDHSVSFLLDNYVSHGYAIALVPVRGTAGNGGCYEWWSDAERLDLQTAVDWIKAQDWSQDAIGFIGLSLGGAAAWMAAGLGDPAIKTIVPMSSETDLYTWFVRNGTPTIAATPFGTPAYWFLYSVSPLSAATTPEPARDPQRWPNGAACPSLADGIAAGQYMTHTGAPNDPRGFVEKRDLRRHVEKNYTGSIFLITGLNDWLAYPHLVYPWVNELEEEGIVVKHLLGQRRHRTPDDPAGAPYFQPTRRVDFAEILLHWFDYWLKGDTRVDLGPRVQVADSRFGWRNEEAWPPPSLATALYPGSARVLSSAPTDPASVQILPDPRRAIIRNDSMSPPGTSCHGCVFFSTEPFAEGLRISGIPTLKVTATPRGFGGHVTAYLYAFDESKYRPLGWATMDLRFATDLNPEPLTPNQDVVASLAFEPLDARLLPGERLVLEIFQGGYGEDASHFPGRALAPAAYYRMQPLTNPVDVKLGREDTVLVVPVVSPSENQLFEAPVAVEP
jgi:putative CocE/NonD family hydrolase